MKHGLIYISLHLIWFHEIHIKYVKRKPSRTMIGKKMNTKDNQKGNEKGAYGLSPGWKIVCIQVSSIIYLRSW